jgi:L-2-hydroxyglutarate oxidase LhgO
LAVARACALRGTRTGQTWLVLEEAESFGTQTSARNSEVIHAGMYYPTGSLKAELCVRGKALLYAYCAERGIGHKRCGKLIVATEQDQLVKLQTLQDRAIANGVHDLVWLAAAQAQALEPALRCIAALHSPSTGIVDSHGLMLSLLGDMENLGGMLALNSPLALAKCNDNAIELVAVDGTRLMAKTVVNAAGLQAPALAARFSGLDPRHVPRAYFAKGSYLTLAGRAPFSGLIYPVPEAAGLGVHLTLDLGGQARFGPDVQWVDNPDNTAVEPERGDVFYAEVRKYWPDLPDGALVPAYAGIRPKISGPNEEPADFLLLGPAAHGLGGVVHLLGIESPGLTSSLAIGQAVAEELELQGAN